MIKKITSQEDLDVVYQLTHDMFVKEGLIVTQPDGRLRHYPFLDNIPETIVYVSVKNGEIIGTVSVTEDGPAKLHTDINFPKETEEIRMECRKNGKKLGAGWRIATREPKISTLMDLMESVGLDNLKRKIQVSLYIFNPRHEEFYKKICGFKTIATATCNLIGGSPPGVLMLSNFHEFYVAWSKFCIRRNRANVISNK